MKQILPLLVFLSCIGTTTFAQNKRAENFSAVKNYFIVKSSNGPFVELTPTKEGLRKDPDIPNKTCYGVYVQTDDHSGAVSAVMTLMKDKGLEFSQPLTRYFRQDSKKSTGSVDISSFTRKRKVRSQKMTHSLNLIKKSGCVHSRFFISQTFISFGSLQS